MKKITREKEKVFLRNNNKEKFTMCRIPLVSEEMLKTLFCKIRKRNEFEESDKHIIHCSFESNATQTGYRKRMIKFWLESAKFNTNKRLTDQKEKDVFSDLEIKEIREGINREEFSNGAGTQNLKSNIKKTHQYYCCNINFNTREKKH